MENFMKPNDKEYMRMAMLKHEETFKEQVYELHRLYRIQKSLMRNIDSNNRANETRSNPETWNSKNNNGFGFKLFNSSNMNNNHAQQDLQHKASPMLKFDLERPANYRVLGDHRDNPGSVTDLIDESAIELTLGPASYNTTTRQRIKKLETPLTSDSAPSFSSSSSGSSHKKSPTMTTNSSVREESGQIVREPRLNGTNTAAANDIVDGQEQFRVKQPPWLFQALSLNMT